MKTEGRRQIVSSRIITEYGMRFSTAIALFLSLDIYSSRTAAFTLTTHGHVQSQVKSLVTQTRSVSRHNSSSSSLSVASQDIEISGFQRKKTKEVCNPRLQSFYLSCIFSWQGANAYPILLL